MSRRRGEQKADEKQETYNSRRPLLNSAHEVAVGAMATKGRNRLLAICRTNVASFYVLSSPFLLFLPSLSLSLSFSLSLLWNIFLTRTEIHSLYILERDVQKKEIRVHGMSLDFPAGCICTTRLCDGIKLGSTHVSKWISDLKIRNVLYFMLWSAGVVVIRLWVVELDMVVTRFARKTNDFVFVEII